MKSAIITDYVGKTVGLLKGVGRIVYEKHLNHLSVCHPLCSLLNQVSRAEPCRKVTMLLLLCPCHSGVAEALVVLPNSLEGLFFS